MSKDIFQSCKKEKGTIIESSMSYFLSGQKRHYIIDVPRYRQHIDDALSKTVWEDIAT